MVVAELIAELLKHDGGAPVSGDIFSAITSVVRVPGPKGYQVKLQTSDVI